VVTALTVAHTHLQVQAADTACRNLVAESSTSSTGRGECCAEDRSGPRRASSFQLSPSDTIKPMTPEQPIAAPRVGVLIRMQMSVRDGLRSRVAFEHVSMNNYLERLICADLAEPETGGFIKVRAPTFASRGKNGTGRPTKGQRAAVILRIAPALREQLHQRAESLQLTVNDYLESLVSQDISAASTPAGEEMGFGQTA